MTIHDFIEKRPYLIWYVSPENLGKANELFGGEFNEKLFRTQLNYFDDVNYEEAVEFLPGFETPDELIKQKLIDFSLE